MFKKFLLVKLVERSKNSFKIDGISHKIRDRKHQFRQNDLDGLLSKFILQQRIIFSPARLFCLVV